MYVVKRLVCTARPRHAFTHFFQTYLVKQEQLRFLCENAFLHFRAVGKRGGRSPLRVLQISHSYLSWKTDIFSVPPGF